MDLNSFNASKYLGKNDVPEHGITLTIAGFGIAEMQSGEKKPYVSWVEPGMKPMLLNRENRNRLAAITGTSQTEAMLGRRVVVFNDRMVSMQGQLVGGLRIRPLPAPEQPQVPQAPAQSRDLTQAMAKLASRAQGQQGVGPPAEFDDQIPY